MSESAALAQREGLFRAVFSDAADAMLILDQRRIIVEANPAAGTLFGFEDPAALVSRSLDSLLALVSEDELDALWRELMALGEAKREHRVAAGRERLVECSYRARLQGDRHLCIARDITERRALEERLTQSEKIESVGRLAGGIAHDFNNLLTAILGYTELLLGDERIEGRQRGDLQEIQRAGQRAASLTQQLLAFSRKQVLLPKDVDLNRTVTDLQGMLRRLIREDVTLSYVLAEEPALVLIDPTQIEQVILNLVLNARDALPAGGEIRLELARVHRAQTGLPAEWRATADEYIRLRVIDNGIGIPIEAQPHVFEPFFTTKAMGKGTGLGLASVYGIVRQSNGYITVDSESGRGTTFTMHFPAVAPTVAPETPTPPPVPRAENRETILLVEDEDAVRVIVSAVLRRQGYEVLEAATPREACALFDRRQADIDLLVSDVVMPEMNGPALAQRLVTARPQLRVLFISGYTDPGSPLIDDNPNIGFLSKPFQASTLATRIREMLSGPRDGSA